VRVLHCQPNRWIEGEVSLKRVTEACVAVSAQCVDSQSTADRLWDHMRPAALYHCSERPQAADAAISAPRYVHAWIVAASSCYRRGLRDQVGACELPLPVLRERPPPTASRKVSGTRRCEPIPSCASARLCHWESGALLPFADSWRFPGAVKYFRFGVVEARAKVEATLRRRQPVAGALAWCFVLDLDIE
jgi:hypothetical protein